MSNNPDTTVSAEALATLAAMKTAVKNALDRKRRLGHYAVVWRDGQPALVDDDAEDRAAFFESLQQEPQGSHDNDAGHQQEQSGIAEKKEQYPSD